MRPSTTSERTHAALERLEQTIAETETVGGTVGQQEARRIVTAIQSGFERAKKQIKARDEQN